MVCARLPWAQRTAISCLSPSDTVLCVDVRMPGWCTLSHVTCDILNATCRRSNPAFQLLRAHRTSFTIDPGQEVVHCLQYHSLLRSRCRTQTSRLPSHVQRCVRRSFCNICNWRMLQRCRLLFLSKSHRFLLLHTDWYHRPSATIDLPYSRDWFLLGLLISSDSFSKSCLQRRLPCFLHHLELLSHPMTLFHGQ